MWEPGSKEHATTQPGPGAAIDERRSAWIGKGVRINGEVISAEDLLIDGRIDGTITVRDHHLIIGSQAEITADVIARRVTVRGMVVGNITASERLQITETGSVDGTVRTPRLAMLDGAVLSGRVEKFESEPVRIPVAV